MLAAPSVPDKFLMQTNTSGVALALSFPLCPLPLACTHPAVVA
jgi:hypothetical protein